MPINQSIGLGIRPELFEDVVANKPRLDFFEAHSENYFGASIARAKLLELRQDYAISLHGVGLSLGRADNLDQAHLSELKKLIDEVQPLLVSEHLAWSAYSHRHLPDLLPLPLSVQSLNTMCEHIEQMQDSLQRQILVENPSHYLLFDELQIPEPEFLNTLAERTGCGLLIDLNNIYVSAKNIGRDAKTYLQQLSSGAIHQYHIAGHTELNRHDEILLIDTHNQFVCDEVWELFAYTLSLHGKRPSLIEWDSDFPDLCELVGECEKAKQLVRSTANQSNLQSSPSIDSAPHPQGESVAELQNRFLDSVLNRDTNSGFAKEVHAHRIWVYQNNYYAAITEYFEQVFPAVMGVVGAEFFRQMVRTFAQTDPPSEGNINSYGSGFAKILADMEGLEELPYLGDLIIYEWSLHDSYFQSSINCVVPSDYSQADLLTLEITFNESVTLLNLDYPIFEIHRQSLPQYQHEVAIDLAQSQDSILIYKQQHLVKKKLLSNVEKLFLNTLAGEINLLDTIQQLQGEIEERKLAKLIALVFELKLLMRSDYEDI